MPAREPAAPQSPEFARLLRLLTRQVEREMIEAMSAMGWEMITSRHLTLLRVLDPHKDGMRISDLASDADVSRQAIQQVVDDLEGHGLVESLSDPGDARARLVRYTDTGRAGFVRAMEEFAAIERAYTGRIGPRRMSELKRSLGELLDPRGPGVHNRENP